MAALALASCAFAMPIAARSTSAADMLLPRIPKKQLKARKRLKTAEPQSGWPRSKNAPTKRKLKRNLVTHSRRVRRKHRRARAA